ncbi:MAG: hypothetical protein MJY99_00445 [Fibrobacter sp.]|nr:hypothetical protein [Fibrobacter sp.]
MKKIYSLIFSSFVALAFFACAHGPNLEDQQLFKAKTGVIGVFRQPAFYCSEANPQYMKLGDSVVTVKPMWSQEQDNLFVTEHKPGKATLLWYSYSCGEDENKLVLDTAASSKTPGPVGVIVPEKGFCKAVISFVESDKLFSHNDALLEEFFQKNKVAANFDSIPYCEVVDNKGGTVSFADRDSMMTAQYEASIKDAADATSEEIYPLVLISESSENIVWNADKSKVLMVTLHGEPDTYKDNEYVSLDKEVWVASEKEFFNWYKENAPKVRNWSLRLRQLYGLHKDENVTHFSLIWVDPHDLIRPAYVTDVTSPSMKVEFDGEVDSEFETPERLSWFKDWFDKQKAASYVQGGYPWTRLGYTYDWGSRSSNKYGLSEFVIMPGSKVEVRFTKNIKSYLNWMADRK